jgi:hypothetical protein
MSRVLIAAFVLLVIACGAEPAIHIPATQLPAPAPSPVIPEIVITVVARTAEAEIVIPTPTPEPGKWETGPPMSDGRSGHIAVKLNDGRVLVAGGGHPTGLTRVPGGTIIGFVGNQSGAGIPTAEILDAVQGEWSSTSPMSVARINATATLLSDGTVLVAGGENNGGVPLDSAEIFDPATGKWQLVGSMASPRALHTATLLPNGSVMVVGGLQRIPGEATGSPDTVEIFNPAAGEWSPGPELIADKSSSIPGRFLHDAVMIGKTHLLVVGGVNSDGVQYNFLQTVLLLDIESMEWAFAEPSNSRRQSTKLAVLLDGRILSAGGADQNPRSETFDPESGEWTTTGASDAIRQGHQIAILPDGRVMAIGGRSGFRTLNSVEFYSPEDDIWTVGPQMSERRLGGTATVLDDGRILVAGGASSARGSGSVTSRSVEIYSLN